MSVFGDGIRPWKRQTETKRAADSSVPGKGELVVSDAGKVYAGDGATQAKNLSPMLRKTDADATYAPVWQPSTAYAAADLVLLPTPVNGLGTRNSGGTSRASFDPTEQSAWTKAGTVTVEELADATLVGKAVAKAANEEAGRAALAASQVRVAGTPVATFEVEDTPVTKVDVGLGNVDNTADINKPMSNNVRNVLGGRNLVGETLPRWAALNLTGITLQDGTVRLGYFTAQKTETVTQMAIHTGTTAAGATPSLIKYAVYSVGGDGKALTARLAVTNSNTALLAAASQQYAQSFAGGNAELVEGQRYALAVLLKSAAVAPTLAGVLGASSALISAPPRLAGTITSQTDLASSYTAAEISDSGALIYGWIAP